MVEDAYKLCVCAAKLDDEARAAKLAALLKHCPALPKLRGDEIIQIGTCCQRYGSEHIERAIVTLGTCDAIAGVRVEACSNERDMLRRWARLVREKDPDVMLGYNIFGFDMAYIKDRAEELGCLQDVCAPLGRFSNIENPYKEVNLSSSALGDNVLKYIDVQGRILIDLMKVVQRDHRLDTYKLDAVAHHFLGLNKNDVSPKDVFRLQRGDAKDRAVIAEYCVQDCVLCNQLATKLDTLSNNAGMANVCSVPLSFIFMRGQGVKIYSLVTRQCQKDGYLVPVIKAAEDRRLAEDDTYEGAIVLDPQEGLYVDDPISVLDYASLYPSSMISENLSHDTLVMDPAYAELEGVEYVDIKLDDRKTCRFAQQPEGVLPRILKSLLKQRKETRKRIELKRVRRGDEVLAEGYASKDGKSIVDGSGSAFEIPEDACVEDAYNEFQQAVLDGLQNAYKVTANSLYGQMGASTSPLCLKDIAASTTATGRNMILKARDFIERNYDAQIVYGDTDSIFVKFGNYERDAAGNVVRKLVGKEAIMASIRTAVEASKAFKKTIKPPHDLEYEKTFWPFVLFSKKRYVGNLYEFDDVKYKQKSMGIVLKRRDNAPIVKKVFGGALDIILNRRDVRASVEFVGQALRDLVESGGNVEDLVITKSLKAHYKDPERIAHHVLAQRMAQRDPGNKPQVNDRIPFMYVDNWVCDGPGKKVLQGDRIEHPAYAREKGLRPDYKFYITNQIMKPVLQLYAIVLERMDGFDRKRLAEFEKQLSPDMSPDKAKEKLSAFREAEAKRLLFDPVLEKLEKQLQRDGVLAAQKGMHSITKYFFPAPKK
jgi:DNA polymerase delta subunit 1